MEPRHFLFVKTGIKSAMLLESGSTTESYLINTASGTLTVITPDFIGSYQSKPLEFNASRVRGFTAAAKPDDYQRDLAFFAGSFGILSADLSKNCLHTVNDGVQDATLLSALSLCHLTVAERRLLDQLRGRKNPPLLIIPSIVIVAQQCNIIGYKIPPNASLTHPQADVFWVPTGDVVTHAAILPPLVFSLSSTSTDYIVISKDRYGRYFRDETLLAEKRIPYHVLYMKTCGRFVLLILKNRSLCFWYLGSDSIIFLHNCPEDGNLLDACLLEKPSSNILLEKKPLATSHSFKQIENKSIEQVLGTLSTDTDLESNTICSSDTGIPMLVKLYNNKIVIIILTLHPTLENKGKPVTCELLLYTLSISPLLINPAKFAEDSQILINSGTSGALPNASLLWITANDTISSYSVPSFNEIQELLQAYKFRGYICNSVQLSSAGSTQEVLTLLAQKRTLLANIQLLKQKLREDIALTHDLSDSDEKQSDMSRGYTFGDFLHETKLSGLCTFNSDERANLVEFKCMPGHYLIRFRLPDQLFFHGVHILDPKHGAIVSTSVPSNFKKTMLEFINAYRGMDTGFTALSLGHTVRNHNIHISDPFRNIQRSISISVLYNESEVDTDTFNYTTFSENEDARNILYSELSRVYPIVEDTRLLSIFRPDRLSYFPDQDARPGDTAEFWISSNLLEKYANTKLIFQLLVSQTRLQSTTHGACIPISFKLPACPLMRLCSTLIGDSLASVDGLSLASLIDSTATLTIKFTQHDISVTKLINLICDRALVALSDGFTNNSLDPDSSGNGFFYVEHCNHSPLFNLLYEISPKATPLARFFANVIKNQKFSRKTEMRLSTVFKTYYHSDNGKLIDVQIKGLDISLLISFAKGLGAILLNSDVDSPFSSKFYTSLSLHPCMVLFLKDLQSLGASIKEKTANATIGLSDLSSRMLLDCNQISSSVDSCSYGKALDQLQILRNSVRVSINQAFDKQESLRCQSSYDAYLNELELSLLFANKMKADDIKAWRHLGNSPEVLEWTE